MQPVEMIADRLHMLGPQITQHSGTESLLELIEDAAVGSPGIGRTIVECLGCNELIDEPAKAAVQEADLARVECLFVG